MTAVVPTPVDRIRFVCPLCRHPQAAAVPMGGRAARCPTCDGPLVVPAAPPAADTLFDLPGLSDTAVHIPLPTDIS